MFLNALNEQAPSYDITPVGVYSVVLILGFMYIFVEHFWSFKQTNYLLHEYPPPQPSNILKYMEVSNLLFII